MDSDFQKKIEILEYQYTMPQHLDINPRMVTYWKGKIILPFFQPKKNGKMNIPQATWLCLIKELSEIGVNSNKLADLAKAVWHKPFEDGYFAQKIKNEISNNNKIEDIKTFESILKDEKFLKTLSQEITPFTDAVIDCVLKDHKPLSFYYFFKSGEHYICNDNQAITDKLIRLINNEPYICVPLMPFIKEIIGIELKQKNRDFSYLSNIEKQIREIIMFKSPKYVELLLDDDKIKPLIIRDTHKNSKQLADFFLNNKLPKTAKLLIEPRAQDNYKITIITK